MRIRNQPAAKPAPELFSHDHEEHEAHEGNGRKFKTTKLGPIQLIRLQGSHLRAHRVLRGSPSWAQGEKTGS
jgi:hypothetical protein